MRLFETFFLTSVVTMIVTMVVTMMVASSAQALVTSNATSAADGTTLTIGDTFNVDIDVTWTGTGSLTGISTSHTWDSSQLALIGADSTLGAPGMFETAPIILLSGTSFSADMVRATPTIAAGVAGDDLNSSARTVQYGSTSAIAGYRAATDFVVRLTFLIIGIGDGVAEITNVNLAGDSGAIGDSFAFGSGVSITVPEPGTALLIGFGLLGLASSGRRNT